MSAPDPENKAEPDASEAESTSESTTDDTRSGEAQRPQEIGGRGGLDPTRYGDWEKAGRCIDF
jgi:hypothetical protein